MRLAIILLSLLVLGPVLPARVVPAQASAPAVARLDDGPYVIWDGPVAKVLRVRDGKAEVQPLPRNGKLELDRLPALALSPKPFRPAPRGPVRATPGTWTTGDRPPSPRTPPPGRSGNSRNGPG